MSNKDNIKKSLYYLMNRYIHVMYNEYWFIVFHVFVQYGLFKFLVSGFISP